MENEFVADTRDVYFQVVAEATDYFNCFENNQFDAENMDFCMHIMRDPLLLRLLLACCAQHVDLCAGLRPFHPMEVVDSSVQSKP